MSISDKMLPKKNRFCFFKTPRTFWDANQQALYQYVLNNTGEVVVVVDGNKLSPKRPIQSLKVVWDLMLSKVIIFDHSLLPGISSKRHIRVNLWHGTPLKKIRFHLTEQKSKIYSLRQSPYTDLLTANSNYDALLMSSAMNIPRFNVLDTGLPRNDFLLCNDSELSKLDLYGDLDKLNELKHGFDNVILWAPTFRGTPKDLIDPLELSKEEQIKLGALLEKKNSCLWIRSHKFSKLSKLGLLLAHPNVFDVSKVTNSNIILHLTDLLITDFSSIWIDFLLLDRPIIIYAKDYDAYIKQQGFILDYKEQIPVPLLDNFDVLTNTIDTELKNRHFIGYVETKNKFHHSDTSANKSELVYKAIKSYKRLPLFISK